MRVPPLGSRVERKLVASRRPGETLGYWAWSTRKAAASECMPSSDPVRSAVGAEA